jgi:cytochrome P450
MQDRLGCVVTRLTFFCQEVLMDNDKRDITAEERALIESWEPRHPLLNDPTRIYQELREKCPVVHSDNHGGFHVVSRFSDVSEIASDHETYSSAGGITIPAYGTERPMMPIELDPPEQGDFRRAMAPRVSMRKMALLEESLREICRKMLAPLAEDKPFDLMADFSEPFPIEAFWQEPLMGRPVLSPMTNGDWVGSFQQWSHDLHHGVELSAQASVNINAYIDDVLEDRRSNPGDDFPTQLISEEVGGRMLSLDEVHDTLLLLFAAGIETTKSALGNMLHYLAHHPAQRRRLAEDPSLIPVAVEELLRLVGPNQGVKRTTTKDVEISGCPVGKGEAVLIMWAAANLDPDEFPEPEDFVVDRSPNRHLAFGKGVHKCIGLHFARLELKVALEEILKVAPEFEIAVPEEELEWKVGIDRTLVHLPVRRGRIPAAL